MELTDLLAAISVVLNGIPQGLLAMSLGFASVPSALGFAIGAIGCLAFNSVAPISFQAETIAMARHLGKDISETLSMIFFGGLIMLIVGILGLQETVAGFAGTTITSAMMAGVGLVLARIALSQLKENPLVAGVSIATALIVYLGFGKNLVYTIVSCVVISSAVALIAKQDIGNGVDKIEEKPFRLSFKKPTFSLKILRGAAAMACLNVGANIAFGDITGSLANTSQNIDQLSIYSSAADMVTSLFGGSPVEAIISATGSAPHPVAAGVLMMIIMAAILFCGLLPKIGKFVSPHSIAGFLLVLGLLVTVAGDAPAAFSGTNPGDNIIAATTMGVTAVVDPFFGMLAGIVLKVVFSLGFGV